MRRATSWPARSTASLKLSELFAARKALVEVISSASTTCPVSARRCCSTASLGHRAHQGARSSSRPDAHLAGRQASRRNLRKACSASKAEALQLKSSSRARCARAGTWRMSRAVVVAVGHQHQRAAGGVRGFGVVAESPTIQVSAGAVPRARQVSSSGMGSACAAQKSLATKHVGKRVEQTPCVAATLSQRGRVCWSRRPMAGRARSSARVSRTPGRPRHGRRYGRCTPAGRAPRLRQNVRAGAAACARQVRIRCSLPRRWCAAKLARRPGAGSGGRTWPRTTTKSPRVSTRVPSRSNKSVCTVERIVCVGGINLDRKLRPLAGLIRGRPTLARRWRAPAAGLGRGREPGAAGVPVSPSARVGDDLAGRALLEAATASGIDVSPALYLRGQTIRQLHRPAAGRRRLAYGLAAMPWWRVNSWLWPSRPGPKRPAWFWTATCRRMLWPA